MHNAAKKKKEGGKREVGDFVKLLNDVVECKISEGST